MRWFAGLFLMTLVPWVGGCDASTASTVSGTITVSPALQADLGQSDTVFITARPVGGKPGPPLAVLRIVGARFPLQYSFAQEDVIMPGQWFSGEVVIQAKLRKTGFVNMPTDRDLQGAYSKGPVVVGAQGVDFSLDRPVN